MPRRKTVVKSKDLRSLGAVDLHFHGAFGIDLMKASETQMDELSERLWQRGIAAFCPTTLSSSPEELLEVVSRLGIWIARGKHQGAIPLGIHLEGPFIAQGACGAHPPHAVRPFSMNELQSLHKASRKTLKILTFAPELLSAAQLRDLCTWARKNRVTLSVGHSRATQEQAHLAFAEGATSVTHAWNALPFHQRAPGVLGAALGRKNLSLELIVDQVHVHPSVLSWTMKLHEGPICFISDAVPAAGLDEGQSATFGPLTIFQKEGACRLSDGSLAGGGKLLTDSIADWANSESVRQKFSADRVLRQALKHITLHPLQSLGLRATILKDRPIRWRIQQGQVTRAIPIDSGRPRG
ncbi:MAG: hypothetical protein ACXWP5_06645 [Bdellovibrionota bacterium]